VREWPKTLDCHQIVTKIGRKQGKTNKLKKPRIVLSDGWQRDLVEFSNRWGSGFFALANRRLQPLGHLSGVGFNSLSQLFCQSAADLANPGRYQSRAQVRSEEGPLA
jgi:hypothetical protein